MLPCYPLECLTRRLDAVQQVTAVRWEKSHDLVLPGRRRHTVASRVEVNNLAGFEFVLPYSIWCRMQLLVLPTPISLSPCLSDAKNSDDACFSSQKWIDVYVTGRSRSDGRSRLVRGRTSIIRPGYAAVMSFLYRFVICSRSDPYRSPPVRYMVGRVFFWRQNLPCLTG